MKIDETKYEGGRYDAKITIGRVFLLADMAENDVWPDGSFGDDECVIWSLFRKKFSE